MEPQEIREHWTRWAISYGADIRATTRTWTAKALEIDALQRRLRSIVSDCTDVSVLEMGCGNGLNCVEMAKIFSGIQFDGVDYISEMVTAAMENGRKNNVHERLRFFVGNVIAVGDIPGLRATYDVVFTVRCLINLNTIELQKRAISALSTKLKPGGHLLMIENSMTSYEQQNHCRMALGLPPRRPAGFNLFFDEAEIRPHLTSIGLELRDIEDFSSLHDLMLYVLAPAINGGSVDYDHPLVHAVTKLSSYLSSHMPTSFGSFGQNRMFVCRKTP